MNNYLVNAVKSQTSSEQKIAASFTIAIAVSVSAIGSLASALFIIVCTTGLVNTIRGYGTKPYLAKHDYIIVIPAFAYFVVNALSLLNSPFELKDLESLVGPSLFVLFYFAVRFYRDLGMENQFELFLRAIPYGSIFMFIWIIDNIYFHPGRMAGGSGNAIPFAMTCVMLFSVSVLNIIRLGGWEKLFNAVAAAIFILALIRSETRSMYLAVPPILVILAAFSLSHSKNKLRTIVSGFVVLLLLGLALSQNNQFLNRISTLVAFSDEISRNWEDLLSDGVTFDTSLSHRLEMVGKSICLIYQRPITGYGIDNRRAVLKQELSESKEHPWKICRESYIGFYYSHFHNGFLTSTVDAGVFGFISVFGLLMSSLIFAVFSPDKNNKSLKASFGSIIVVVYGLAGITNILFGHDIMDSMFLYSSLFLILSQGNIPFKPQLNQKI